MAGHRAKKNHADLDRALTTPSPNSEEDVMARDLTKYVTTSKAAEMLGSKPRNVQRLLEQGRIKGIKPAHDWMVFIPSITKYLESKSNRGRPTSGTPQPVETS